MAGLLGQLHVTGLRLRGAVRKHWKRLVAGAFCGWVGSTVVGAFVLAALEANDVISHATAPVLGAAFVWSGVAAGALIAYARRAQSETASGSPAQEAR
jgi:hypothetical protein